MKRIAILGSLAARLLAAPAFAVTLMTAPVTIGPDISLRCNISNLTTSVKSGSVCTVNPFSNGTAHICHPIQISPGGGYASPVMATDNGSWLCRFTMDGQRSNFVAAGIVDTGNNAPVAVLPAQ
jgi:hypothetical protein